MTQPIFGTKDLVRHISGTGPTMAVEYQRTEPTEPSRFMAVQPAGVFCAWFDKNNQLQRARFDPDHLRLAPQLPPAKEST